MKHFWNTCQFGMLCSLLLFNNALIGQTAYNESSPEAKAVFVSNVSSKKTVPNRAATSAYRFHKRLSGTYTGYTIEIGQSDRPLERKDPLFRQFGNVFYHKMNNGRYSYLITTSFNDKQSWKKFYETVILPRNPDAKMVEYKLGKRHE